MEEYPIYAFRTRVGTMTRQPVGLYDDWTAQLPGQSGLLRVYLVGEVQSALLGTPAPADDGLRCCRKLARSSQPQGIACAACCRPEWAVWQQDGALLWRIAAGCVEVATLGGDAGAPVEDFPRLQQAEIDGRVWWVRQWSLAEFYAGGSPVDCAVPLPAAPPELPEDPEIAEMPEMPGE